MNDIDRAESVFAAAVALAGADRAAYLEQACAGDPALRQRVEALLRAHDRPAHFLDRPAAPPQETVEHVPDGVAGTLVAGRYKLLEAIGEGGMGTVWMAEQREPVKRLVALKLIKPGMDSTAVLARFEAERQALALMDHPHIAKVLDGGTSDHGHPYFVMELVKGLPLTEYCDERRLNVQERLHLFVHICCAVQHAHQKGIIHRDLKPSNILVTEHDGKPVPKVIDFGLAKALGAAALTERTLHTAYGTAVGTPLYMAPEQVGINALDVDTRTDIYALGAILYELLTGTTPLEKRRFKEAAWDEVKRLIGEEEPPRPSLRLSSSDALPTLAARRQMEPAKLSRSVKGDLDWITLKALEKDRNRRYETANGLALDVERHLSGEPVLAAPPSVRYRLGKFLRKRRGPVLAASLVVLALLAGIMGTSWGLWEAMQQRDAADYARAKELDQRNSAEANATKAVAAAREEAKQRKLAETHAKRAAEAAEDERQAKNREAEQRQAAVAAQLRAMEALRATTDDIIEQLLSARPVLGPAEKAFLETTIKRWQAFAAERGDSASAQAVRAEGLRRVADLRWQLGEYDAALAGYRQAAAVFENSPTKFSDVAAYRLEWATCHYNQACLLLKVGQRTQAEEQFRKALDLLAKLASDFPTLPHCRCALAIGHYGLGQLLYGSGQRSQAEERFHKALDLLVPLVAEFPTDPEYRKALANTHNDLGLRFGDLANWGKAIKHYRKALGLQEELAAQFQAIPLYRQQLALSHNNLANALTALGQWPDAEKHYHAALDLRHQLAADFPAVPAYRAAWATCHWTLGVLLKDVGRWEQAQEQYSKALAIQEKLAADFPAVPDYREDLALTHNSLGNLLANLRQLAQAEEHYRQGLVLRKQLLAGSPTLPIYRCELAQSHNNLASVYSKLGEWAKADEHVRAALEVAEQLSADHPLEPRYVLELARSHHLLSGLRFALGRLAEAEAHARKGLDLQQKLAAGFPAVPSYRHKLAECHINLGVLLFNLGKPPEAKEKYLLEAEEHLRTALRLCKELLAEAPTVPGYREDLALCHHELGMVLRNNDRAAEAEDNFRKALESWEKLAAQFPKKPLYRINVGLSCSSLGGLLRDGGKPADSLDWFVKAIVTLSTVEAKDSRPFVRNAYWNRARALDQLGRHEDAVKDWNQAMLLSQPAERGFFRACLALSKVKAGQVSEAVTEVAELSKSTKWTALTWYNLACVYALASGKDKDKMDDYAMRSVELLRRAIGAGYKNVEQLRKDPHLDALRGRADFQQLIESLAEAKNPAPM
jgi:serine/threonine protein kinase/tetratricopeptide (TPR) repeat protein